jgi:hypothetical protein
MWKWNGSASLSNSIMFTFGYTSKEQSRGEKKIIILQLKYQSIREKHVE